MTKRRWLASTRLLAGAALFAAAPGQAQPNRPILAAVEACEPEARALLEQLVAIDSGTGDVEGLEKVGAIYAGKLRELGAEIREVPSAAPAVGDNIVATFTGTGRGRILLIAHMDTVFERGDVAARMPRWEGDRYIGPGAGDDKSGGVTALCALGALRRPGIGILPASTCSSTRARRADRSARAT
jgi:glutamate carboxypeptidase